MHKVDEKDISTHSVLVDGDFVLQKSAPEHNTIHKV